MRDRPGYTAHCTRNEQERSELLMRRRIRDIHHKRNRRMTFTTIENDRFADDEYDEESVKSESSVRKMSVFKG